MRTKKYAHKGLLIRIGLLLLLALMCFCLGIHYQRSMEWYRYSDYIDRQVRHDGHKVYVSHAVSYHLGNSEVSKEMFMALKATLLMGQQPTSTANFETSAGVFGGTEESYVAVNQAGKEYLYTVVHYNDGRKSFSIISE